ncbi:MAG TPA: amidase [Bryobacteraceae bacterium]|nr:amidase [Bryobacteraceae bacterium]HOL71975.1 amidase [Bryobacteraceae bacterium]HOQ44157.1 amidase [Bryobacteraceae bacterium]HPQ15670.1 amidase [Bryobacteraceae bacterium]HPU70475.1 amidase [Bryobacteraceae bacterium]
MTLLEAAAALRAKRVSSSELVSASLARIAALDERLNSFITVTGDSARREAERADRELAGGIDRGPLHGIPIALKDVFCTKGVRTTCGSKIFADHVPARDAAVVEKLTAAGAVLIGKTNMHELAYGITSNNPHWGAVRNPWDLERIPGGSSGGSAAAVAAGMVFAAMGSDTGGSIRIPASYCGCVGLKPTFGRVSRFGVLPLDFTLDHMGPLARSVRDAAAVLNAIAGFDPRDESSSRAPVPDFMPPEPASIAGIRIGLPENHYFDAVDEAVGRAVRRAAELAETLGARAVPVRVPDIAAINTVGRIILLAEATAAMTPYLDDRAKFGPDVLALLDQGRFVTATDYVNAQRLRRLMRQEFDAIWEQADCLFTPTTPIAAPRIGETTVEIDGQTEDVRLASTRLVRALNVLGLPAISLPCGFDPRGLPLGLQIVGPAFQEARLLRIAAAIEDALGIRPCPPEEGLAQR